ncbi:hypothetical protein Enr13x_17310 [Stieleria neptunia]|uniref:Uncharacterized protein n=1 Tax=Stieleria neptunia TaxID=2527979 RepID=A0A518HM34_9BACT|nr:hypothetical protein [Stieleria neptunia]QDV41888.1 hypothetical protein Enr13x_17310 [Stieleria neptunia]
MSTSSDKQTPSLKSESAKQVITTNWDQFTALVEDVSRAEFATWLDEELIQMEKDLDRFVTSKSRYGGRR